MRQRFQFSLGRLLGFVTACSVIAATVRAFWGTWILEAAILNVLLLSSVTCVAIVAKITAKPLDARSGLLAFTLLLLSLGFIIAAIVYSVREYVFPLA